jgi:hypothetical protein
MPLEQKCRLQWSVARSILLEGKISLPKSSLESQCISYCNLSVNIYLIIMSVLSSLLINYHSPTVAQFCIHTVTLNYTPLHYINAL